MGAGRGVCESWSPQREWQTVREGLYYGGWVTPELTGPFKGAPGSEGW